MKANASKIIQKTQSVGARTIKAKTVNSQAVSALALSIAFLLLAPTASGSWVSQGVSWVSNSPKKVGHWVEKQSGVYDSNKKAQQSMDAVTKAVNDIGPETKVAVISVTDTSNAARDLLVSIKWPALLALYCGAFWLAGLAVTGWGKALAESALPAFKGRKKTGQDAGKKSLPLSWRFALITAGCMAIFIGAFIVQLCVGSGMTLENNFIPFLPVAAFRSIVAATLLCLIPFERRWQAVGAGVAASFAIFLMIAAGPEPAGAQAAPAPSPTASPAPKKAK